MTSPDPAHAVPARSLDQRPVARLTSAGEMAALVPLLCGYVPTESLVVVSLRGPRRRVGLTMRFDLPGPGSPAPPPAVLVQEVAARLRRDEAAGALVVVFTGRPDVDGALPETALVRRLETVLAQRGTPAEDALLVRGGRWWSWSCEDHGCCPPGGTPLPGTSPALTLVEAEQVLEGRAVLRSRADLVASVAPPVLLAARAAQEALARAAAAWSAAVERLGRDAVARAALDRWDAALRAQTGAGQEPDTETAAGLAVSLHDLRLRDEVATWALTQRTPLLGLLTDLARRTPPPWDPPVCVLLAQVAHLGGDGGLANVALDRALASDPDYSLAVLWRQVLDAQVGPSEVRRLLEDTAALLTADGPDVSSAAGPGPAPAGRVPARRRARRRR